MTKEGSEKADADRKSNKRTAAKLIAASALIALFSTIALADFPVIDVTVNAAVRKGFLDALNYWREIHGHWKDQLQITKTAETVLASLGIDVKELGWDKNDRFRKEPAVRAAADAIDELQKIMSAEADRKKMADVRVHIEEIYGDVPVTRAGAKVEAAYRDIASTAAFTGESNKSIEEMIKNADRLKADIESGTLAPGDLERYQVLEADLRLRAQLLQTQAQNQNNKLLMHIAGLKAAEEGRLERSRLRERYRRAEVMTGVMFSPAIKKAAGEE